MAEWITELVESWGYWSIVMLMFLENIFPPIPSELIMPLAGFGARRGELSLIGVCIAGTAGSVAGQVPLYFLGRAWGYDRVRRFIERYGRWFLVDVEDLDRAGVWFDRHGMRAVVLCRLVPGVRSLISIPAGIRRLPMVPFLAWSALGMGVWASALAMIGSVLGRHYKRVGDYLGSVGTLVLATLVAAAVVLVWLRRRQRRRRGIVR